MKYGFVNKNKLFFYFIFLLLLLLLLFLSVYVDHEVWPNSGFLVAQCPCSSLPLVLFLVLSTNTSLRYQMWNKSMHTCVTWQIVKLCVYNKL